MDNSFTDYNDRLKEVKDKILHDPIIQEYIQSNSYILNKSQERSYYNVESILDRCATYLLRGQYDKNNIMTIFDIRKAIVREIPFSSANGNAEDLAYSNTSNVENDTSNIINASSDLINYYKPKKKHRENKTKKIFTFYKTKKIQTYKVTNINKSDMTVYNISNPEEKKSVEVEYDKEKPIGIEHKTIGNQVGFIDMANYDYSQSKWCLVDTDGIFNFNGNIYQIDNSVEQYKVINSSDNVDKFTNESEMEKILAYKQDDNFYFFDENINQISNNLIILLK